MATGRAAHATHGVTLDAVSQTNSDGTTLPTGGMPTTGTIWLTGTSDSATCGTSTDYYYLDVELQPLATAFTNVPNYTSPSMVKLNCVAQVYPNVVISGLAPGDYHWQARERAPTSSGGWSLYAGGALAFTTGPAPRLTLSPTTINFGNQATTGQSAATTVTMSNPGTLALSVTAANVTGPFALSGLTFPVSLAPGGTTTFGVSFGPTTTGGVSGSVTFTSNATGAQSLSLSGTGVSPLSVTPSPLTYTSVNVGNNSTQTLTIANTGSTTFNITSLTIAGTNPGDFHIPNVVFPSPLAGGTSLPLGVQFAPTARGSRSATLTVGTDLANSPTVVVSLSGTGVAPVLSAATSLAFGSQPVATKVTSNLSVSNAGDGTLTISGLTFTGTNAADFGTTTTFPVMIAAGSSASIALTFTAGGAGTRSGKVTLATNDPTMATHDVALSGTGLAPMLTVSTTTIAFGDTRVGTTSASKTVLISNTGSASLTVNALTLGGRDASKFMVTQENLPLVFGAGAQLSLNLTYAPDVVGMHMGTLTIGSNDPAMPLAVVNLSGQGTSPQLSISPLMLDFGNLLLNTTSSAQQVTVTNTGSANMSLTSIALGGAMSASFMLGNLPTLPLQLTPNQSAIFTVTANNGTLGAFDGTITIQTSDATVPSAVVSLHGVGVNSSTGVGGAGGAGSGAGGVSGTAGNTGAAGSTATGTGGITGAAGNTGAAGLTGTAGGTGTGGFTGAAGTTGTGHAGMSGQGNAGTSGGMVGPSGGCGCDTGGGAGTGATWLALLGLALAVRPRARRRRPATAAK
jgi:MYXO-CTERM domain-containing protein